MKLVLIQGDYMANYQGRAQEIVIHVGNWDGDWSPKEWVESFRVHGKEAVAA